MDDAGESGASEQTPPKIKAEDNPWYLLATLYGVPQRRFDGLRAKNRTAWNRYFAANLYEESRTKLIEEKRHPPEELTPFSPDELREVATAFAERSKASAKELALPASNAEIDFSNVDFERDAVLSRCLFSSQAIFNGASFSGGAYFGGASFSGQAAFVGATFSGQAVFSGATFSGEAFFDGAAFSGWASFCDATFSSSSFFRSATFSGWADFNGASFSVGGATFFVGDVFRGARVSLGAFFDGASFSEADFDGATFSGNAGFEGATFSGKVGFEGATFSSHAHFGKATFGCETSFVNAEMKDETSFEGAIFKTEPPDFNGAKLHQRTVWRGIEKWPLPKNKNEAGAFIDAYACLKLEMDRLKKHEDDLDFFALELQSRRMLLGPWRGWPIWLYGVLSDYGRSYACPFLWLLVVAAIGAVPLVFSDALPIEKSFGLSFANTLNIFGFRKDFFDAATIEHLPAPLKILSALQTILGTILLFLFGLGIRNKFRMK